MRSLLHGLRLGVCVLATLVGVDSKPASAQDGTWRRLGPPPIALADAGFYDATTRSVWLSGNFDDRHEFWRYHIETGEWDHLPLGGALLLNGITSVLDPTRRRVLTAGGYTPSTAAFFPASMGYHASLDGLPRFHQHRETPIIHRGPAAYDPIRDRFVLVDLPSLYYGPNQVHVTPADLSGPWQALPMLGSPPSYRYEVTASVFDRLRDRIVFYGGHEVQASDALWAVEFSPEPRWVRLLASGEAPGVRSGARMVMDEAHDRAFLFGDQDSRLWILHFSPTLRWESVTLTGDVPSRRRLPVFGLDEGRRELIIAFGTPLDPVAPYSSDIFALDIESHISRRLYESTSSPWPVHTRGAALAQDPVTGQSIIWAGHTIDLVGGCYQSPVDAIEVDQDQLTLLPGAPSTGPIQMLVATPSSRPVRSTGARFATDAESGRHLLFGGEARFDLGCGSGHGGGRVTMRITQSDVWELRLLPTPTWTKLPVKSSPRLERYFHAQVFDPARARLVVACGYGNLDTAQVWTLEEAGDSLQWTALPTIGSAPGVVVPIEGGYTTLQAAFDAPGDRMIVLRSDGTLHQLAFSDSNRWSPLGTTVASVPLVRASMAFDEGRRALIFHAGRPSTYGTVSTDFWQLDLEPPVPSWKRLSPTSPHLARATPSLFVQPSSNRVLVHGGIAEHPHTQPYSFAQASLLELLAFDRFGPTSIVASHLSTEFVGAGIRLSWRLSAGATARVSLERRARPEAAWTDVADALVNGEHEVVLFDAEPGDHERIEYRIRVRQGGEEHVSSVIQVTRPRIAGVGIASAVSSSDGRWRLTLDLPLNAPARIEMFDVAGRRSVISEFDGRRGRQQLEFATAEAARGIHWLRLSQLGASAVRRAIALP